MCVNKLTRFVLGTDTRLGDYLDSKVLPELISFLEFKEQKTPLQADGRVRKKPVLEDLVNRRFQVSVVVSIVDFINRYLFIFDYLSIILRFDLYTVLFCNRSHEYCIVQERL